AVDLPERVLDLRNENAGTDPIGEVVRPRARATVRGLHDRPRLVFALAIGERHAPSRRKQAPDDGTADPARPSRAQDRPLHHRPSNRARATAPAIRIESTTGR